jgi:hypothetical protein
MNSQPQPNKTKDTQADSPLLDQTIAAALWIGAVCLVTAVHYGATQGVNPQFSFLLVVLHQYYGQWVIAGLAAIVGLGMWLSAIRRMKSVAPAPQGFREGAVVLESFRWFQASRAEQAKRR